MKPLLDRVLVRTEKVSEMTSGGIIIPNESKELPSKGVVVAVGEGFKDEPMELKIGDKVIFGKFSGTEINHNSIDCLLIKQSDIYAII